MVPSKYRFRNFPSTCSWWCSPAASGLFGFLSESCAVFIVDRSQAQKENRMDTRAYRFHNFLFDLFTVLIPAFVLDRS